VFSYTLCFDVRGAKLYFSRLRQLPLPVLLFPVDFKVEETGNRLVTILSSFTIDWSEVKPESLSLHDWLRLLDYASRSYLTPYVYLLGIATKAAEPREAEHTKPHIVGMIHRTMKTLMLRVAESDLCCSEELKAQSELQAFALLEVLLPALLTSVVRRGGELRQVFAHTLLGLYYYTGDQVILKYLDKLVEDTYEYYAKYAGKAVDVLAGELRYLAYSISEVKHYRKLSETVMEAAKTCAGSFSEWIECFCRKLKEGEFKRELLFGRLCLLIETLRSKCGRKCEFDRVVTIATGQWSLSQAALLLDHVSGHKDGREEDKLEDLITLYTQNVLDQVMLARYYAERLQNALSKSGQKPRVLEVDVAYIPVSATDPRVAKSVVDAVVEKYVTDKTLVLAQGPAYISLYLYSKARSKTPHTILI